MPAVRHFFTIALHGVGGEGDDWCCRQFFFFFALSYEAGGFVAIHFGHAAIHEDEVEGSFGGLYDGFLAIAGRCDVAAALFEDFRYHHLIGWVVFDQQDLDFVKGDVHDVILYIFVALSFIRFFFGCER